MRRSRLAYPFALLLGVATVAGVFPRWALLGQLPAGLPPRDDFIQHVVGQLYFLSQPWHWPLLVDRRLDTPAGGVNIAFTDSIPLVAVLGKLLHPLLPGIRQYVTLYQVLAWLAQPVAAVFALRSTGERRLLPAAAAAMLAASLPTFLFRLWHAALDGQFVLLVLLGLYLRIVRRSRQALAAAACLVVALLLIHPYLMLMGGFVLSAAPLTLAFRRDPFAVPAAAAAAATGAAVWALGAVLGYWGADPAGGFGLYSMNVASPVWPAFSALFPGVHQARADATGGQIEGYQYLGAGLLLLLAAALVGVPARAAAMLRRHAGLAVVLAGLTLLAVSDRAFLLHRPLWAFALPDMPFGQMRASGRLFWPCAYALLLAAIRLAGGVRRLGPPLLVIASALQFADAATWREVDRASFAPRPYGFDAARLGALFSAADRLTVLPAGICGEDDPDLLKLLWLAAPRRLATDAMYVARNTGAPPCLPASALAAAVAPGDVRVLLPGQGKLAALLPGGARDCRRLDPFVVCTREARGLDGLPPPPPPAEAALRRWLPASTGGAGVPLLAGWTGPEGWGSWSTGTHAYLVASVPDGAASGAMLRLTIDGFGAVPRGLEAQEVTVTVDGHPCAHWSLTDTRARYAATVPATGPVLVVRFDIAHPVHTVPTDPRRFGIGLYAVRLDAAGG